MLSIVLTATIVAAIGLWLFFQRKGTQTAAAKPSNETEEKKHVVSLAVLKAELAVTSDANALERGFRLARNNLAHHSWLAGLTPRERELHRQSVAALEAAAGPATTNFPPTIKRSVFCPPEPSGDAWIDHQIDKGFQGQVVRRQHVLEQAASSLRSEPQLLPFMEEALGKLGREDLWAQIRRIGHAAN